MQGIDLGQVMFIWANVEQDTSKLEDEPPVLPAHVQAAPPEAQAHMEARFVRKAQFFDAYRTVRSVSMLLDQACVHLVNPIAQAGWPTGPCSVGTGHGASDLNSGDEAWLVDAFWGNANANTFGASCLAGWQIDTRTIPLMIGKAMYYDIAVPDGYLMDPLKRWPTTGTILSVDALYHQGIRGDLRPLPELADLLEWWGVQNNGNVAYPLPHELAKASFETWRQVGCRSVELYLYGMRDIVRKYYGYPER